MKYSIFILANGLGLVGWTTALQPKTLQSKTDPNKGIEGGVSHVIISVVSSCWPHLAGP